MSSQGVPVAVTVVAAIDSEAAISQEAIVAAFSCPQTSRRESDFPGRMTTRIYADAHVVVKLRTDFPIPQKDPVRWVQARIRREQGLAVYPLDRTWFVSQDADGVWFAGTASLRRKPMHLYSSQELENSWNTWAKHFCDLYIRAAASGWRLDEGASNFAFDDDGARLNYLDDDLYIWDNGNSLAMQLKVACRRELWMQGAQGRVFAEVLRESLLVAPAVLNIREFAEDIGGGRSGQPFLDALAQSLVETRRVKAVPKSRNGKIAVLADIHANLDALEAVLAQPEVQQADSILVLGDNVGYGPDPEACVQRLASLPNVVGLRGNHDAASVDPEAIARFTKDALWVIEWTRPRLSESSREWLKALPLEQRGEGWMAVHGAPVDPQRMYGYVYQMTCEDNFGAMDLEGVSLAFHGHTHIAGAWVTKRRPYLGEHILGADVVKLAEYHLALVCPGSVGQPRDKGVGAGYAMFDPATKSVAFRRVNYDYASVQSRMQNYGFPSGVIRRLSGE